MTKLEHQMVLTALNARADLWRDMAAHRALEAEALPVSSANGAPRSPQVNFQVYVDLERQYRELAVALRNVLPDIIPGRPYQPAANADG